MSRDRSYPKPQLTKFKIKQDEVDSIRQDSKDAKELKGNKFFLNYIANKKQSILELTAKQLIGDATQTTESNGVKKTVVIPSKKEYTLLAGQYRFIDEFLEDMNRAEAICSDMEEKIKSGELEVNE